MSRELPADVSRFNVAADGEDRIDDDGDYDDTEGFIIQPELRSDAENPDHFLRSLRAAKSSQHFLRSLRTPMGFEDTPNQQLARQLRGTQSHFLRSQRGALQGESHFLRSLKSGQNNSHFLRSLRTPIDKAHFLRYLRASQSHFLRSLRQISEGKDRRSHFLRSL